MRKNFTELKDVHKGQDIWIVCGGPSMNYVHPSFFEGKITMGVGEIFKVIRGLTYYMRKDGQEYQGHNIIEEIQKHMPESKLIVSDHYGCAEEWPINDFETDMDYYYFEHLPSHGELSEEWNKHEGKFANGIGTAGIAVHLCAYMGAKNIIICGNDTVFVDHKDYIDGYGAYDCGVVHSGTLNWGRPQTLEVVKYFRSQGINIHGLNPWVDLRLEGHTIDLNDPTPPKG